MPGVTAKLVVISGPAGSGKTEALLARYRASLAENRPGESLWLAPTWRAAADVRRRLLDAATIGFLAPGVLTFDQFAESILEDTPEPIRPLSRFLKRRLVGELIDDARAAGRLTHFAPIAATAGLVDLLCDFLSELKRLEIWPEDFQRACDCTGAGVREKDREILDLYRAYQQQLQEHCLYDAEGRFWSARDWLKKSWSANEPAAGGRTPWPTLRLVVADGFTDFTRTQHEILDILAWRAEAIVISLPLQADSRRAFRQAVADIAGVSPASSDLDAHGASSPRTPLAGDGSPGAVALWQPAAGAAGGGCGGFGNRRRGQPAR